MQEIYSIGAISGFVSFWLSSLSANSFRSQFYRPNIGSRRRLGFCRSTSADGVRAGLFRGRGRSSALLDFRGGGERRGGDSRAFANIIRHFLSLQVLSCLAADASAAQSSCEAPSISSRQQGTTRGVRQ